MQRIERATNEGTRLGSVLFSWALLLLPSVLQSVLAACHQICLCEAEAAHSTLTHNFRAATQAVFSTSILCEVGSIAELEQILRRKSAGISSNVSQFQVNLPVAFTDYTQVSGQWEWMQILEVCALP